MFFASRIAQRLQPVDTVEGELYEQSKRWLLRNGVASQVMETLAIGTFLTALALNFGASNAYIGLLAAVPHMAAVCQLGGVYIAERVRNRRLVCVVAATFGRLGLLFLPVAAFIGDPNVALPLLFVGIAIRYGFGAIVGASWNPWVRDLISDEERGRFVGRRLTYMLAMGMLVSLLAAGFIDHWPQWFDRPIRYAYAVIFICSFLAGIVGIYTLTGMAEPRMPPSDGPLNLTERLAAPFKDENFRKLMIFLASWHFAANLAAPFFTVHMLTRLGIDLFPVTVLAMCSQLANILVLQSFGRIADRFSNKAVLAVAAPLFVACTFAWIFTTAVHERWAVFAILGAVHVLTGFATAGVSIATINIAMKLAPKGNATGFLASSSLVNSMAAGSAPMIGGLCADFFAKQKLSLMFSWESNKQQTVFESMQLEHWDFYFVLAALIGLYSLHRLAQVNESGVFDQRAVIKELFSDTRRTIRTMSSIAGLRAAAEFPFHLLHRLTHRRNQAGRDIETP
ncbi:MAG: MFS transporter [Proteobacteria bacterium]|nr:MFS transporter [Pseudomonadota bacterium]